MEKGIYKITFYTKEYFEQKGVNSFYPFVEVSSLARSLHCIPIGSQNGETDSTFSHTQIPFEVKVAEEHYRS